MGDFTTTAKKLFEDRIKPEIENKELQNKLKESKTELLDMMIILEEKDKSKKQL